MPSIKPPELRERQDIITLEMSALYSIRIKKGGEQRFSGLIALESEGENLRFVLLDATGILLLESEVRPDESHKIIRAVGQIGDSRLPDYLADLLYNIVFAEPESLPCAWSGLMEFCRSSEDGVQSKILKWGPVTLWSLVAEQKRGDSKAIYRYSQPWLGMSVELRQL